MGNIGGDGMEGKLNNSNKNVDNRDDCVLVIPKS